MSFDTSRIDIVPGDGSRKILIVRLSAMGDVIHTLPAAKLLREAFPEAHIGWLVEERWAELLCARGAPRRGKCSELRPLVDEVHTVRLKDWRKSPHTLATAQSIVTIWNDVRGARYEVAVDLQGAIRSAVLARCSGARVVYGAAQPREAPASLWYTRKVMSRGKHVVEQNVSVALGLTGLNSVNSQLSFNLPRDPAIEKEIDRQLARDGIRDFAILNPGAGWGAKRWPLERYGVVAQWLAGAGIRPMINYGPGEEGLFRAVVAASNGTASPLGGELPRCTITELIAWTRRARIFVGGDTGPLHLAAALRVPVVGIYGPTDPARNGPYGTRSVVLRSAESSTSHTRRSATESGLMGIETAAVVAAAEGLLSDSRCG